MNTKILLWATILLLTYFCTSQPAQAEEWLECKALGDANSYKGRRALKYLVPGIKDWLFISKKDFMMDFSMEEESIKGFQALQEKLKEKGTTLALVVPPQRGLIHADKIDMSQPRAKHYKNDLARKSFRDMIETLQESGLHIADAPDFLTISNYGYPRDHHWNAAGAEIIAQQTASMIKKLPVYQELSKKEFVIKIGKEIDFKGTFYTPIKEICDTALPPVKIKERISTTKTEDLFGNTQPDIVLVGTSFSEEGKSFANFVGHLRVALSADIDNRAMGGGGVSKTLLKYLASDDFNKKPPKILIWEIPGFYHLNRAPLLMEATTLIK